MRIYQAGESDNEGLLKLTSLTPMSGEISIRIDRKPDFFRLLDRRGTHHVLVAEDRGRIVGSISAAQVSVYVDGNPELVQYLGDLKTHPDFQRTGLAFRLVKSMHQYLKSIGADLVMWTAAYGNIDVLPFFDGRAGLPKTTPIGTFRVCQILPSARRQRKRGYDIREEPEHEELSRFYDEHYRSYQFGPCFGTSSLRGARHWTARSGGRLLAAVTLTDVADAKQNVLIRLPRGLSILIAFLRLLRPILHLSNMPRKNEPVRILYVRAIACTWGQESALDLLIQKSRNVAFEQDYHFLAVGIHERDPVGERFAKYPKFTFKSMGFVVGLRRSEGETQRLMNGIPYEDYSLV